jgi:signal transduction histidine kinase/CheY-like chemotaxis protein
MRTSSPLFRRYARILVICMGGLTCAAGIIHMAVVADAQWESVATLLDAQTRAASGQIQGFLDRTIASLQWIDDLDQPGAALDLDAIVDEAHRLLRRTPSVISLAFYDAKGCARLMVSRLQPDVSGPCEISDGNERRAMFATARKQGPSIGEVFFPDGSEPHLLIGIPSRGNETGALVAEINLKVIHDTIAAIPIGRSGLVFVVDSSGRLLAHPDEALVLRQAPLPEGFRVERAEGSTHFASDFSGQRVATASRAIHGAPWRIVAEQPVREALAPVFTALWTTGILVMTALLGSLIAGFIVARRLARPLSQLRDGAARIGRGDLATQLNITTGDEIEQVAQDFNRMALALAESHAHLEAKVADRTAALHATTLKVQKQASELSELNTALAASLEHAHQSKADAERANAAKSRFLAVASHDLRQPMHAVSLLVGLLGHHHSTADQGEVIRKIQRSVDAMEDMFVSLLDISKLDARAVRPAIVDFLLEEILQRIRGSLTPLAESKALALYVESSTMLVRTDPGLLERILFNLVSNAIRYTAQGHVRVFTSTADGLVTVTVEDTGIGIPEEFRDRIYDEFFQVAPSSNHGLGLGLSIVKQSADLLGHALSLQSGSSGSRFQLRLPLAGHTGSPGNIASHVRVLSEKLSSAFVVIIDDDADNRFAAEQTYRQWGCHTVSVDSEAGAISALSEHLRSPDLIVTDLNLAGGATGLGVIEAIRRLAEFAIPAIVLSGDARDLKPDNLPECCILLQKPAGPERLQEASECLLAQAETSATNPMLSTTS